MRNIERKRQYDRDRYAKLREEHTDRVREAERLRKQRQRKKAPDPYSMFNQVSLDTPAGARAADKQRYIDSQRA